MAVRDVKDSVGLKSILPAQNVTAAVTNTGFFDCLNALFSDTVFVNINNLMASTVDVMLQEAIEDPANLGNPLASNWSNVDGGGMPTQTVAGDVEYLVIRVTKRFLRAVITLGLAGGGGAGSAFMLVALLHQKQTTNSGTGASMSPTV